MPATKQAITKQCTVRYSEEVIRTPGSSSEKERG
jgi:hypothetical protein